MGNCLATDKKEGEIRKSGSQNKVQNPNAASKSASGSKSSATSNAKAPAGGAGETGSSSARDGDATKMESAKSPSGASAVLNALSPTKMSGRLNSKFTGLVAIKNRVMEESMAGLTEKYTVGKELGHGAYGTVTLIKDKQSGKEYACKSMAKSKLTKDDKEWIRKEAKIMQLCQGHPNIVEYVCAYEDDKNVHFVLGLCSGGELFDRIVTKKFFSERDARELMRTMLKTTSYLHSKNVVHRDFKPENFLLDGPGDNAALKLTDFGVSDYFTPGSYLREKLGSPTYVAPEVLMGRYNEKCDIWSLGIILYILLCGRIPFPGRNEQEEFMKARRGKFSMEKEPWPRISKEAKDLVKKMLTVNIDLRPSAEELIKHPWIADDKVAKDINLGDVVFEGLQRFSEMNKLKKRAIQIMSKNLKEEDVAHLKTLFRQIDTDGSGSVTPFELKQAMKQAGTNVTEEELDNIVKSYDVDEDGEIDITEFVSAMTDLSKLNTVDNIRRAFAEFDKDHSGTISAEEVLVALQDIAHMDMEKAKEVVKQADKDGNGEIDWEEFYEMMVKNDEGMMLAVEHQRKRTFGKNY